MLNLLDWAEILFNLQLEIKFTTGLYLELQK